MKESEKKNNQPKDSFVDSILDFCRKNVKYISAGILFLLLILVMAQANGFKSPKKTEQTSQNVTSVSDSEESEAEEKKEDENVFQKNAVPKVNELMETYYQACADGDEDTLKKCAKPISTVELSYRKVCGKYIASYQNIDVYTKPGLKEGDYIVSVYYEMKLRKVKTLAPGLDMFYVEKQKDGSYCLNNVCTQYNLQNKEYDIAPKYQKALDAFEKEPEVKELIANVQKKYEDAISSDAKLERMITKTFQKAVAEWAATKDSIELADASKETEQDQKDSAKKNDSKEKKSNQKDTSQEKATNKKTAPSEKKADSSTDTQKKTSDKKEQTKKDNATQRTDKKQTQKKTTKKKQTENKVQEITPETVYATVNVNVRKEPKEDAEIYEQIAGGTQITRTGKTADDWSAVDYNGKTAYIKSEYLTTAAPAAQQTENSAPIALPEGKTIRLSQAIVVRKAMGEDHPKIGTAFAGENVTIIQSYAEGWTKINWNGVDGYAKTDVIK